MSYNPILAAEHISLSYPQRGRTVPVLNDVSLALQANEIVAILGFSGSGKSSLLRVLAGLNPAQHGQVLVHGQPSHGPHAHIGFMFQDPCLLPWLNVEENVALGLRLKNQQHISKQERKQRVAAMLEEVGLSHAAYNYPSSLSGGMAQRASLARSLVRQPHVLLLDEPFSALDAVTRAQMQQLLVHTTQRHNTAAVLVTHDIDEALNVAQQVILLGGAPSQVAGRWQLAAHTTGEPCAERQRIEKEIVALLRQERNSPCSNKVANLLAVPA